MIKFILRFTTDVKGATSVEYAVMLALVLLIAISAIALLGTNTGTMWTNNHTELQSHGLGGS